MVATTVIKWDYFGKTGNYIINNKYIIRQIMIQLPTKCLKVIKTTKKHILQYLQLPNLHFIKACSKALSNWCYFYL